jgi:nucleoside 2-deoxyribosyltransferase
MNTLKAYIASPLGFSEAHRFFYKEKLLPLVSSVGFDILDPWVLTPQPLIDEVLAMPYGLEKKSAAAKMNRVIGANNARAICECDVIVAILDGTDVDSGTAAEIGFGAGLEKVIVGYRGDFRLAADNEGSLVNLQVEYFATEQWAVISTSLIMLKENLLAVKKMLEGVS